MRQAAMAIVVIATGIGWTLFIRRLVLLTRTFSGGAAELPGSRTGDIWRRTNLALAEILGHTRFARRAWVRLAHWAVMVSFIVLVATLVEATVQVFAPSNEWSSWPPVGWLVEGVAWTGLIAIAVLTVGRQIARRQGRASRFFGSAAGQAYFVEATIGLVVLAVLALRGLEHERRSRAGDDSGYPTTAWIGDLAGQWSDSALGSAMMWLAVLKIVVSMTWLAVVGLIPTMGIAWHRFLAPVNIWTKRRLDGRPALGPLEPIVIAGAPVDLTDPDALDDEGWGRLGVGKVADLTWKDRLDITTCTECGRCQELCPAFAAGGVLSPKFLVMSLRDQLHQEDEDAALVGPGGLAPEALWACTTCACTQACPVDIEHIDHVIDLRRHQVLVAGETPVSSTLRNLERRGNPWGLPAKDRLAWTSGLDFPVPVVGTDIADLTEVDYLLWVGCAGAFDDNAKKTTRAVAELLHRAGVSFAVLGTAESCCGDQARRVGDEAGWVTMASGVIETLDDAKTTRVVTACPHCLNTVC